MEINDRIEQLIKEKSKDRIFPILRKIDYLWTKHSDLNLCDIIKLINNDKFEYFTDDEIAESLQKIDVDKK